jgi:SHS2 domain-containing protein
LVEVSGRDLKQLLVSFLEEILYQFETREFLLSRVEDVRIEERAEPPGYWLLARFKGNRMRKGDEIFGDVKAITYNEMEITQGPDGVFIQVVVDI